MPKGVRRNPTPEEETTRWRIASLVREGKNDQQIADTLGLTIQTVYHHLSELYGAAGIDGRRRGKWEFRPGDIVGRRGALRHWLNGDED